MCFGIRAFTVWIVIEDDVLLVNCKETGFILQVILQSTALNFIICIYLVWKKLGENVEPSEIEEGAMGSSLIQQIVVIGQVSYYYWARN